MAVDLLSRLDWQDDRFVLAGRTFLLQHQMVENVASDAFVFYKNRGQVEQFQRFLAESGLEPRKVLELGIWDGGSAAFWTELLDLERYSALDLQHRGDSDYFTAWRDERAPGRVATHWGVSQSDTVAIDRIIADDDLSPLDLVLDDCSHQYRPTLDSFDHLFPKLRPGGWYVIEDWAWDLQPEFQSRTHPWSVHPPLHPIGLEIVRACAARPDIVPTVRVYPDFVAIERGASADLTDFSLADLIPRRQRPWGKVAYRSARARAGAVKARLSGD